MIRERKIGDESSGHGGCSRLILGFKSKFRVEKSMHFGDLDSLNPDQSKRRLSTRMLPLINKAHKTIQADAT